MSAKNADEGSGLSRRPYLLRAMHEWIIDSGHTPHVIVDALRTGVEVPAAYVKDGKIVLNLSTTATQRLQLTNESIEFDARFAGIVHRVRVPMQAVLGVYARETGEGMVFSEGDSEPTPPEPPPQSDKPHTSSADGRRAKLTVVK
jgi:stringent starvation protein B